MKAILLPFVFLISLFMAAGPQPIITVQARPAVVVSAPLQYLDIEVHIQRSKPNRGFCVVVDGPEFYSAHCEELAGEEAPVIFKTFALHLDEDGVYSVTATLLGDKGKILDQDSENVLVGGSEL